MTFQSTKMILVGPLEDCASLCLRHLLFASFSVKVSYPCFFQCQYPPVMRARHSGGRLGRASVLSPAP